MGNGWKEGQLSQKWIIFPNFCSVFLETRIRPCELLYIFSLFIFIYEGMEALSIFFFLEQASFSFSGLQESNSECLNSKCRYILLCLYEKICFRKIRKILIKFWICLRRFILGVFYISCTLDILKAFDTLLQSTLTWVTHCLIRSDIYNLRFDRIFNYHKIQHNSSTHVHH